MCIEKVREDVVALPAGLLDALLPCFWARRRFGQTAVCNRRKTKHAIVIIVYSKETAKEPFVLRVYLSTLHGRGFKLSLFIVERQAE